MSVYAALYSGVSGITSNGSALAVSGDNISNISTPGFKSAVPVFESALTQQLGNAQIGLGGDLAATSADFSSGNLTTTTSSGDLAIQGNGFFVVSDSSGNQLYTRAGQFVQDANGNVVMAAGNANLQGYAINSTNGAVSPALSNINLAPGSVSASPVSSSIVSFSANLDSGTPIRTDTFSGASATAAQASSDYNTSVNVYDSLGNQRTATVYFRHEAAGQWTYHVATDGSNLSNGPATGTVVLEDGEINFDTNGNFTNVTHNHTYSPVQSTATLTAGQEINKSLPGTEGYIQWAQATPVASIEWNFGNYSSTGVMTQVNGPSQINNTIQDGRGEGILTTINYGADGTINGSFTNGTTRALYKIPLALFANNQGLTRAGSNTYSTSASSGIPQIGLADGAGRGSVNQYKLEQSNVDIATEFVKIITYQRAFQASSRTVSTAAELLQDLVNLGK